MLICFNLKEKNLYMYLESGQFPEVQEKIHIRFQGESNYIIRVVAEIEKHYSDKGCIINYKLQEIKDNE